MKKDSQISVNQNQILQLFGTSTLSIEFLHTLKFREFQITQKQFDYSTETITTTRSPFYPSLLSSLFLLMSSLSSSESFCSFSLGGRRSLSLTGMTTGIREWTLPVNHVIRPQDISRLQCMYWTNVKTVRNTTVIRTLRLQHFYRTCAVLVVGRPLFPVQCIHPIDGQEVVLVTSQREQRLWTSSIFLPISSLLLE